MLRWSRFHRSSRLQAIVCHKNRRLSPWLLCVVAAVLVLTGSLPALAAGIPDAPRQSPAQAGPPQRLNFIGNTAQVEGIVMLNQNQAYVFFGSALQRVQVILTSNSGGANFEVRGANNIVYKALSDPATSWQFTLPETQDYFITVASSVPANFVLTVTLGTNQPQRITFNPGQTTVSVNGSASPSQSPQYIFTASAGQSIRIVVISAGNLANFSLIGASDGVAYKPLSDPRRDWTSTIPVSQDYLITVSSPSPVTFTLQITLSGTTPPAGERINFAPGQTVATVTGQLSPNVPKVYIFAAGAGTVRILLSLQTGGTATFGVTGVTDNVVYKQVADPNLDFTFTSPFSQDYRITLLAPIAVAYALQVTIPGTFPPTIVPPTITPLPTVPTGCVGDAIQNGGFETNAFWIFGDSPIPPVYEGIITHTPLRAVRLGIDPDMGAAFQNAKSFSSIRQPFQISPQATVAQLRWWQLSRTEEAVANSTGPGEDSQQVILLNPDMTTLAVLRSVRNNAGVWQEQLLDLTPYIGKNMLLYFNVYNDGNGKRTWQYIDDVMVSVCYPAVTATPVIPTSIPTLSPPTFIAPTVVLPTLIAGPIATTGVVTAAAFAAGVVVVAPAQAPNGEPTVMRVAPPPPTRTPPPILATRVAVVATVVSPGLLATPQVTVSLWFGRSPVEVLTIIAVMVGVLALIGMLVGVGMQSGRRRP